MAAGANGGVMPDGMMKGRRAGAAFAVVTCLFFAWGFITALNDPLVAAVKGIFTLTRLEAQLVAFAFFIAYGLMSFPAAGLVARVRPVAAILCALALMTAGCLIMLAAANLAVFPLVLAGLFVLASGITILQVCADPLVAALGDPARSHFRLTLSQTFNSFATFLASILGAHRRIMISKFELGLFDHPFVDPAAAVRIVGNADFRAAADDVQRRAQVLLKDSDLLPLRPGTRVYVHGLDAATVRAHGLLVVDQPDQAQVALFRLTTPSEVLHPNHFFGSRQKEGRLDFRDGDPDYEALKAAAAKTPVIASIYLDRPAILTNIRDLTAVLLGNFGASDDALLDVLMGKARAEGHLPFELPSSMAAVKAQQPGRPDDSAAPLYPVGFGIHRAKGRGAGGCRRSRLRRINKNREMTA